MMIKGRVWKFGNNIDTDQIYPGKYLPLTDKVEMARHAMEGVPGAEEFISGVQPGDIIVAGKNFGCGSSREHAGIAIKGAGISCIIAESFASIFYRNSINIGLPLIVCAEAWQIANGDNISVDLVTGKIVNLVSNERYQGVALSGLELEIVSAGGLLNYMMNSKF